jgi:hypothetical protein
MGIRMEEAKMELENRKKIKEKILFRIHHLLSSPLKDKRKR